MLITTTKYFIMMKVNKLIKHNKSFINPHILFEQKIKSVIILISSLLMNYVQSKYAKSCIIKIIKQLEELLELCSNKPSISNINLETIANSLKKQDNNIEKINLQIIMNENPDWSKVGCASIKLF